MQSDDVINEDETESRTNLKADDPWVFRCELGLAVTIIAIVIVWALWPFLNIAKESYIDTTDMLGHLVRIKYMADCFMDGKWPAWFPNWYNGSIVMQYYPPFSYMLLAMVQMLTDNVMITFKITVFLAQFIGALGVWYICYRFIGSWVGIVGGVLYAVQPFLLTSLLKAGEVAQIPMFAITPWLLCYSLLMFEKRTPLRWLLVCISGALLILSQSMTAYLMCICMGCIMLVLLIRRNISIVDCLYWVIAMGLGAGLEAFWSVPGVTHLENSTLPYSLSESIAILSTHLSFFKPAFRNNSDFYAGYATILLALGAIVQIRKNKLVLPLLVAMLIGVYLSFGPVLPLYNCIPMNQDLLPRKFLGFSVLAAAILFACFLKEIVTRYQSINYIYKVVYLMLISFITVLLVVDINPRMMMTRTLSFTEIQQELNQISDSTNSFEQGRLAALCQVPSYIWYFPVIAGFNMTYGYNSQGTPHIYTMKQNNIAIPSGCPDYVVKNLLNWNTRYVYISHEYAQLRDDLIQHGFRKIKKDAQKTILINSTPSSYFMRQERNAIAIGLAAPPLVITFPWLIQGESASLEDYSLQDLDKFRLIYLIEPDVKDFLKFQKMVIDLVDSGKTVVVSMGNSKVWPLAGVNPYWETVPSDSNLIPTDSSPFKQRISMESDPYGQAPAIGNLDGVWMEMDAGNKRVPAIGYKNINGHRLYFVGLNLEWQLNAATRWARGYQADVGHSKEVASLLEQIMDIAQPNKNIVPAVFPVSNALWGHDGFSFHYNSEQPVSILVSVTYAPRWKGKLDNSPLKVQQIENLILLDLPAGEHQVSMHYGMTWVGWLGIGLSVLSLLFVVFIYCKFDYIDKFFNYLQSRMKKTIESIGR